MSVENARTLVSLWLELHWQAGESLAGSHAAEMFSLTCRNVAEKADRSHAPSKVLHQRERRGVITCCCFTNGSGIKKQEKQAFLGPAVAIVESVWSVRSCSAGGRRTSLQSLKGSAVWIIRPSFGKWFSIRARLLMLFPFMFWRQNLTTVLKSSSFL